METVAELCSICSKLLIPSSNAQAKLLQTPCLHLFHRTCLKTWFRGIPLNMCCPECTTQITWQEVSPWKQHSELGKSCRVKKEEPKEDTSVPRLLEENRQKNAAELVSKRLAKNPRLALLELQKQETLEREKALAEKKKLANIQDKMCKGYARRQRKRLFKRVFFGIVTFVLVVCVAVYCFKLYRNINPPKYTAEHEVCAERMNYIDNLMKDHVDRLREYIETKDPVTIEEEIALQKQHKTNEINEKEIKVLEEEFQRSCKEKLGLGNPDSKDMFDAMIIKNSLTGNGWSLDNIVKRKK